VRAGRSFPHSAFRMPALPFPHNLTRKRSGHEPTLFSLHLMQCLCLPQHAQIPSNRHRFYTVSGFPVLPSVLRLPRPSADLQRCVSGCNAQTAPPTTPRTSPADGFLRNLDAARSSVRFWSALGLAGVGFSGFARQVPNHSQVSRLITQPRQYLSLPGPLNLAAHRNTSRMRGRHSSRSLGPDGCALWRPPHSCMK
jgi:hypothetical protein